MSGNRAGGLLAAKTNKERYGEDIYKVLGAKGGSVKGVKKGFAANPKLAAIAGSKGGSVSKRSKATNPSKPRTQPVIGVIAPKPVSLLETLINLFRRK